MKYLSVLSPKMLYRIILILVLGIFLLVNLCGRMLADRFDIRLDMTGERLYALSAATYEVAAALEEPTDIYVISDKRDYPVMLAEMLARYGRLSEQLSVIYMDPYVNVRFLDYYRQMGYTLEENHILVEGPSGIRQIRGEDMLIYTDGQATGIQLEQQLTGALLYVNSPDRLTAGLITGHNERPTTALQAVFQNNNYTVESVYLSTPQQLQADILVLAGPTRDLTEEEVSVLSAYLEGGGRLMVFLEPGVVEYPNLAGLLAEWNLAVGDNVILEERAYVSDNPLNLIAQFGPHEINLYFVDNRYFVVMPAAREVQVLGAGVGAVSTDRVLLSGSESYAKEGARYDTTRREEADTPGPFTLAAMAEKEVSTRDGMQKAAVFLAGSQSLYADDIMGTPSYANREFLTQVAGYMTETGSGISIEPKTMAAPSILIRLDQSILCGLVLAVVLPLLVLTAGIVVCVRRKNL